MKTKYLAMSKLATGETRAKDMSLEIAATEQKLRELKEKKDQLDQAVGKLQVDIIRAKSKLSKKQVQRQEKALNVKEAHKSLKEAKSTKDAHARQQEELKLSVRALLR